MAYTTESLTPTTIGQTPNQPSEFNLPTKEFIGYDPKGTTTITGSPLVHTSNVVQKNSNTTNEVQESQTPAEAPVPKVPEEESVTLSPKVSAIARKEQALRAQARQIAEKEKALADKLAMADKYQQIQEKIRNKDYSATDELGLQYEEIVKHELTKEASKNPEQERVRQLEEKLEALQKAQEENAVKEYQANQTLWKQEIAKTVKENDEFSTIRELGAEDIVQKHINDSFEEDDVELTVEQACKEIEEALVARAEKFASVTKVKNKLSETKVLGAPKSKVSTITQNMTTTPKTAPASKPFHLLSETEQIAEAIRRVQAAKLQR